MIFSHESIETRYANETEERFTTQYEVRYRPNTYDRHSFEPRTEVGTYLVPQFRDVPVVSFETQYEILYREEEEHRYRTEI